MDKNTNDFSSENNWSTIWAEFSRAENPAAYFNNWLLLQSTLIPDAVQSILILNDRKSGTYLPVAQWSNGVFEPERLREISEHVLENRSGFVTELDHDGKAETSAKPAPGAGGRRSVAIAYPVLEEDTLHGVVAAEISIHNPDDIKPAMQLLQWGIAGLTLYYKRVRIAEEEQRNRQLKAAVDLLAGVLTENNYNAACVAFVTELATMFECDRVSLGILEKENVTIKAMSHSADFSKNMNLIKSICMAMEEAVFQRSDIVFPVVNAEKIMITKDHEELAHLHGSISIMTIPLYSNEDYYGALTFERSTGSPFSEDEIELSRSAAVLAIPVLKLMRSQERLLVQHMADSCVRQAKRMFGPDYLIRKTVAATIALLVIFFSFAKGDYRLSADTVLEGTIRRVVAAPFNGYVRQANARAGDVVKKGSVLCIMDDRDLSIERVNWISQESQLHRQYQEALAKHNRAEVNILRAKLDQASAQLRLAESKIERTKIAAPFDGILVSGDLSQRLGGAVEQGEVLFEIAPLDSYRVILKVDERRIGDVKEGQSGQLLLSSMPSSHYDFTVENITPISTSVEGRNFFRVEARLSKASPRLRPGMEGVGKISIDRRRLISIWTRGLTEWLRLWVWSWWP